MRVKYKTYHFQRMCTAGEVSEETMKVWEELNKPEMQLGERKKLTALVNQSIVVVN